MSCPICGGVDTCPAGDTIVAIHYRDIHYINPSRPIPQGLRVTHRRRRHVIAVPTGATLAGTAQSARIVAHHPHLRRVWVGQCLYAFVPSDEEEE